MSGWEAKEVSLPFIEGPKNVLLGARQEQKKFNACYQFVVSWTHSIFKWQHFTVFLHFF